MVGCLSQVALIYGGGNGRQWRSDFDGSGALQLGAGHWQTLWEREFGFARVEQRDWEMPRREDWVPVLDDAVAAQSVPVILVAHSLGCITVLFWAASALEENLRKVKGALLVAPSDTERPEFPPGTTGFKPIPLEPLPFHSITVASTNDRYISLARSEELARAWSSSFENVGTCGHISGADGFGPWPEGLALLDRLRSR